MEKNCQNCNRPNAADAAFCRHCASPLSAPGQGPQPQGAVNQGQQPIQQGFGGQQQPQNPGQPAAGTSQRAMLAAGLAVAGLVCCGPFTGIPAAIVGWLETTAIKEGRAPQSGMQMAQVGLWGGIIVSILGTIAYFLLFVMSMFSDPTY